MIYEEDSKESSIENKGKYIAYYPFYETLILDDDKVAIVIHETKDSIRIKEVVDKILIS
mgnify:CR=1 FL=1